MLSMHATSRKVFGIVDLISRCHCVGSEVEDSARGVPGTEMKEATTAPVEQNFMRSNPAPLRDDTRNSWQRINAVLIHVYRSPRDLCSNHRRVPCIDGFACAYGSVLLR